MKKVILISAIGGALVAVGGLWFWLWKRSQKGKDIGKDIGNNLSGGIAGTMNNNQQNKSDFTQYPGSGDPIVKNFGFVYPTETFDVNGITIVGKRPYFAYLYKNESPQKAGFYINTNFAVNAARNIDGKVVDGDGLPVNIVGQKGILIPFNKAKIGTRISTLKDPMNVSEIAQVMSGLK